MIREELARGFGCSPEELALTRNTSEGLHTVLLGLDFKRGDEVLTTTQDYPSMLASVRMRAQREGVVQKQFAYPAPAAIAQQLFDLFFARETPRTRAILVSHMTFTTGQIFPVFRSGGDCEGGAAAGDFVDCGWGAWVCAFGFQGK